MESILEQWKTLITSADNASNRRMAFNVFAFSLNTPLFSIIGALKSISLVNPIFLTILAILGIVFCWYWRKWLNNANILNTVKFDLINKMESEHDELYPCFSEEWKNLKANGYKSSSEMEKTIPPFGFIFFYVVLIGYVWFDILMPLFSQFI